MEQISEHFWIFLLLLAFIFGFTISICRKIYIQIKSPLRNATIIGYRYSRKPFWATIYMPTRFWPVITYDEPQYGENVAVKSLNLLIPENHKIKLRMHKERFSHFFIFVDVLLLHYVATIMFALFFLDLLETLAPIGYFIVFSIFGLSLTHFALHDWLMRKQLGTKQALHENIKSEKPENYENYTELDFTRIENAELVTYQEAMAHYYKESKYMRTSWLQNLYLCAIAVFILYINWTIKGVL
mgnify:CR=1 FL=1|tara:strand:+ start:255414 stop:256139 length:726 start_codon:yes stop_codon:yes gene_type:complete